MDATLPMLAAANMQSVQSAYSTSHPLVAQTPILASMPSPGQARLGPNGVMACVTETSIAMLYACTNVRPYRATQSESIRSAPGHSRATTKVRRASEKACCWAMQELLRKPSTREYEPLRGSLTPLYRRDRYPTYCRRSCLPAEWHPVDERSPRKRLALDHGSILRCLTVCP